ncbi:hypothetical protein AJ80_03970, partial [Polytolypa hystricis UAMH7299]
MFATLSQPRPTPQLSNLHFLAPPPRPSPLSVHNGNIPTTVQFAVPMSFPNEKSGSAKPMTTSSPASASTLSFPSTSTSISSSSTPATSTSSSSYAHRYTTQIANPASRIAAQAITRTSARRDAFMNRVKHARDEGLYTARGEQMQRMDYLASRRRNEEAMAREAPDFSDVVESEDDGEMEMEMGGLGGL